MKISSDKWRVEIVKEIQKSFDPPTWFDQTYQRENPVSIIEKDGLENEITPVMVAKWVYEKFRETVEKNELNAVEVTGIIDEILPKIEKAVTDYIAELFKICNDENSKDWEVVRAHTSLMTVHPALLRFKELIFSKLETHRKGLNIPNEVESIGENQLPEIELKTQKEQIRLLYDLGVLDFLREKYPNALHSNNQLGDLVAKILKINKGSAQPTVNAVMTEQAGKNYPKASEKTKLIIDHLNAYESN